jgi:hypothetical protein
MKLVDISGTKRGIIWKTKTDEPESNSKVKNTREWYRGINEFRNGYQPITDILKNEKGDLVTDSHNILARWRNHFSQLLMYMEFMMCGRRRKQSH